MEFIDQMARKLVLKETPKRVISLVPSQTEFLYDIGLDSSVVGITKFCIHPKVWFDSKSRVGGTKSVSIDKVKALKPDFIIGNKEENTKEDIEALEKIAPVWMSDIITLKDSFSMMESLGEILNKESEVKTLLQETEFEFKNLEKITSEKSVAYFIWNQPQMIAGQGTFINSVLENWGLRNHSNNVERYPVFQVDANEFPDYIFLSSEPFPYNNEHLYNFEQQFPNSKVILVDGEMFSWYGSRLKNLPKYLNKLKFSLES
jgi:ABC-type Fe3+-hydroxamate transport system substrate-binding protein